MIFLSKLLERLYQKCLYGCDIVRACENSKVVGPLSEKKMIDSDVSRDSEDRPADRRQGIRYVLHDVQQRTSSREFLIEDMA